LIHKGLASTNGSRGVCRVHIIHNILAIYHSVGTPSPKSSQNLENKGLEKIFPRKIFHSKEIKVKYSIQRTYAREPGPL
jgi:hypothetical protein